VGKIQESEFNRNPHLLLVFLYSDSFMKYPLPLPCTGRGFAGGGFGHMSGVPAVEQVREGLFPALNLVLFKIVQTLFYCQ
jgi:hypothetical protein